MTDVSTKSETMKKQKITDKNSGRGGGGRSETVITALTAFALFAALLAAAVFITTSFESSENNEYQVLGETVDGIEYTYIGAAHARASWDRVTPITDVTILSSVFTGGETCTVTAIAGDGFKDCTTLQTIIIPSSVDTLDNTMFQGCTSLTSVTMDGSFTQIPWGSFYGCTNLVSVTMPSSVTTISAQAFNGCVNLENINLSSVKAVGSNAFHGCISLTTVDLSSVEEIYGGAFENCTGLVSIDLGSLSNLGAYAFAGCTGLINVITGPSLTIISDDAFLYCANLTSIDLSMVKTINFGAFAGCTSLTNVDLSSLETIQGIAFASTGLTHVFLPATCTTVAGEAFMGCLNLQSIEVDPASTSYCDVDGVLFTADMRTLAAYPAARTDTEYVIPDGVEVIGGGAFSPATNLNKIVAHASVTTVGLNAFRGCRASIIIPVPLTYVAYGAFYGSAITELDLSTVTVIEDSAFTGCDLLRVITLPEGFIVTSEMGIPETTVLVYIAGEGVVSASATMNGTVVTLNIVTEVGYGVDTITVTIDNAEAYSGELWSFDVGGSKIAHVWIDCIPGFVIKVPSSEGGYYQYRLGLDEEYGDWTDVINGSITVPTRYSVQIIGIPYAGYSFEWNEVHQRDVTDGILTIPADAGNGTVNGMFTELASSNGSAYIVMFVSFLILLALIFATLAVSKKKL